MGEGDARCNYHLQLAMPLSKALFYGAMGYINYLARVYARFENNKEEGSDIELILMKKNADKKEAIEANKEIIAKHKKRVQHLKDRQEQERLAAPGDLPRLEETHREELVQLEDEVNRKAAQLEDHNNKLASELKNSTNDKMKSHSGFMYMRLEGMCNTKRFEYEKCVRACVRACAAFYCAFGCLLLSPSS